jgi:uncharacterized coiled-coil protein SlyX
MAFEAHLLAHVMHLEEMMATQGNTFATLSQQLTDLTTAVQATNAEIATLSADVNAEIAALKAQIAAGTPVTQAQLDQLAASVTSIQTAVTTANASLTTEDQTVNPPSTAAASATPPTT